MTPKFKLKHWTINNAYETSRLKLKLRPRLKKLENISNKLRKTNPLLHIVPFCEGPNKKPEGFAKQKQPAKFAMPHASHLVVHQPSLLYNVH